MCQWICAVILLRGKYCRSKAVKQKLRLTLLCLCHFGSPSPIRFPECNCCYRIKVPGIVFMWAQYAVRAISVRSFIAHNSQCLT